MSTIQQPALPYALDALSPYISAETMNNHYNRHHKTYIDKLNGFIDAGQTQGEKDLETIVKNSQGPVFNNAAQTWNHNFFWPCLIPHHQQQLPKPLETTLVQAFGSMDALKQALTDAAAARFGSGWVWLVQNQDNSLAVISTPNAENPLTMPQVKKTLFALDVWEHAYYLDTQYNRVQYVDNVWQVINWTFVAQQLN